MSLSKRALTNPFLQAVLAWLAAGYVRLVRRTTRWSREVPPATAAIFAERRPAVACFWHGRMLVMREAWRDEPRRFHMLISGHRDGAFIARAMRNIGCSVITGSGTGPDKGGRQALLQMREVLAEGKVVGITPDGPRGPLMRAKGGAIAVAQAAGAPIVPVSGAVRRGRRFQSWDRFLLPWPFNRGILLFGEPILVPAAARLEELERIRRGLEAELIRLTQEADRRCGREPIEPGTDSGRRPRSRKRRLRRPPQEPAKGSATARPSDEAAAPAPAAAGEEAADPRG